MLGMFYVICFIYYLLFKIFSAVSTCSREHSEFNACFCCCCFCGSRSLREPQILRAFPPLPPPSPPTPLSSRLLQHVRQRIVAFLCGDINVPNSRVQKFQAQERKRTMPAKPSDVPGGRTLRFRSIYKHTYSI